MFRIIPDSACELPTSSLPCPDIVGDSSSEFTPIPVYVYTPDFQYDVYRRGLITRHLCLNGRVDEGIWLRQVDPSFSDTRLSLNCRRGIEYYTTFAGVTGSKEFVWCPIARHDSVIGVPTHTTYSHPSCDGVDVPVPRLLGFNLPISYASGENPLLVSGLAMATFSLESLQYRVNGIDQPVSKRYSLEYAKQIFNFILESEMYSDRGGCLLRRESPNPRYQTFLASLDELLGVCVGLLYYWQAIRYDSAECKRVEGFVQRIGRSLSAHGYWLFPWAKGGNDSIIRNLFKHNGEERVTFKQCGWVFGYALNRFLKFITGEDFPADWDAVEQELYFEDEIPLGTGSTRLLNWAETQVAIGVKCFSVTSSWAFRQCLDFLSSAASEHLNHGNSYFNYHDLLGMAFGKMSDNYFNFHLLSLACILITETGESDGDLLSSIGTTMAALLKHPYGYKNAMFGVVLHRICSKGWSQDLALAEKSIEVLRTPPFNHSEPILEALEHDLPLYKFDALYAAANLEESPEAAACVSAAIGKPVQEWIDKVKEWDLPISFNFRQWGGTVIWASKAQNRVLEGVGICGTDLGELAREVFSTDEGRAIVHEACGVGLLFTRMLAARFSAIPPPKITDVKWASLPYLGTAPNYCKNWNQGAAAYALQSLERNPQRELVGIKINSNYVNFAPSSDGSTHTGLGFKFGSEGYIKGLEGSMPFRGYRMFHYGPPHRPDLFEYLRIDLPSNAYSMFYYIDFNDHGCVPDYEDWLPCVQVGRTNTGLIRTPARTAPDAVKYASDQIVPLLHSSSVSGVIRIFCAPHFPSAGNEQMRWDTDAFHWTIRVNGIARDSPFPYVVNVHQGTVHLISKESEAHMREMFSSYNAIVLPIKSGANSDIVLQSAAAVVGGFKARMAYSIKTFQEELLGPGQALALCRKLHLCPRCFQV